MLLGLRLTSGERGILFDGGVGGCQMSGGQQLLADGTGQEVKEENM